jgi:NAD(P)H-hydrate epimerase
MPADPVGKLALLTNEQMRRADAAAIAAGIPGIELMERAGAAIFRAIVARWRRQPVLVLCGPGNNGGDGYVAARLLQQHDWPVTVAALAPPLADTDAAAAAAQWGGETHAASEHLLDDASIVVDAMFGAGLGRPLEGMALRLVEALAAKQVPVLAVDVPSGVDGDTGAIRGAAPSATVTVGFFRAKPGHWLMPGRERCGELVIADIGIADDAIEIVKPDVHLNDPVHWRARLPWPGLGDHKYSRGHLLVLAGAQMTGAGRLAVRGARRSGAGMVTLAADPEALPIYAQDQPGILTHPLPVPEQLPTLVEKRRIAAILLGPGAGVGGVTKRLALAALSTGIPILFDADALTVFSGDADRLIQAARGPLVLTPHEGEFQRLFPDLGPERGKLARARMAAKRTGAVVLFKGIDSVIADPEGRALVNNNAPADLASAGTGDVLAGIIAGLLAQRMPAFEAAAAGAWLHGEAGRGAGPGLIAEDLPGQLPALWKRLRGA